MAASVWNIYNLRTDVDTCNCTLGSRGGGRVGEGGADTVTEPALEVDSGREKNPLPHWGLEPASVLRLVFQSDALPTELFS